MVEQTVKDLVEHARSVAVLTGAGISAESGIPTFRGPGGLWRRFRPEDLATPEAFARDPKLVWEWYDWRRGLIAETKPNPGHEALVRLEDQKPEFTLITQNVDGLHDLAGSRNVLKVHGDIWTLRCTGCKAEGVDRRPHLPELPPRCEKCEALLRPGVVWFGEGLPQKIWRQAEEAAARAQVFLVIGTSAAVYPAAGLAASAKSSGAVIIEINPDKTEITSIAGYSLRGKSGEVLSRIVL